MSFTPVGPGVVVDDEGAGLGEEFGAVALSVVVAPERDRCSGSLVGRWEGAVVFEVELELAVWAVGDHGEGPAAIG